MLAARKRARRFIRHVGTREGVPLGLERSERLLLGGGGGHDDGGDVLFTFYQPIV